MQEVPRNIQSIVPVSGLGPSQVFQSSSNQRVYVLMMAASWASEGLLFGPVGQEADIMGRAVLFSGGTRCSQASSRQGDHR